MTALVTALAVARASGTERTLDEWRALLTSLYARSIQGILDWARAVYEFQQSCPTKKGGSIFGQCMNDWLGWSEPVASHWARIGSEYSKLCSCATKLPASWVTIYWISFLPADVIMAKITPRTTSDEVRAIKRQLDAKTRRIEHRGKAEFEAEHHEVDIKQFKKGLVTAIIEAAHAFADAYDDRDVEKLDITWDLLTALRQKARDEVAAAGGTS